MVQKRRSGENKEDRITEPSAEAAPAGREKPERRSRTFDYGELRLLLLAIIAKQPSHRSELTPLPI